MPYTEEFTRILMKYRRQYNDKAKAETFAFQEAFSLKIPTFQKRALRFKIQKGQRGMI
jgi:predicted metal-binding protein